MRPKNKFFEDFIGESLRTKMKLMRHEVQAEEGVWEHNSRQPISKTVRFSRFIIVFAAVAIALGAIIFRTAQLQIIEGNKWRAIAEGNRIREIVIPAVPKEEILARLEKIFEKDEIRMSYQSAVLLDEVSHQAALSLMENLGSFPGIEVLPAARRNYPEKEVMAHSVGYIGKLSQAEWARLPHAPAESGYLKSDFIGKSGLEYVYENDLRGLYGWKRIEVDSMGREQKVISETPALAGKDLI